MKITYASAARAIQHTIAWNRTYFLRSTAQKPNELTDMQDFANRLQFAVNALEQLQRSKEPTFWEGEYQ